jgi:hypothetical protein
LAFVTTNSPAWSSRGPFSAGQLSPGSDYELSNGHAIHCLPTGGRGGGATLDGGTALASDPDVEEAGIDVGYAPEEDTLRAPDVSVGNVPDKPGWVRGVPPLAVEYADAGQDEESLQAKIADLLGRGTKYLWVARLVGPRRVEVYEPGKAPRLVGQDQELTAPGILRNPVPVLALFDRRAAFKVTLRNLLQREGYESVDAVRDEGRLLERAESILEILAARGIAVDDATLAAIRGCKDMETLKRWRARAAVANQASDVTAAR